MVSCEICIAADLGYLCFSQPAICSGDHLLASLSETIFRRRTSSASLQDFGRLALFQACLSAETARYFDMPLLRLTSREIVEAALLRSLAIALSDKLAAMPRDISSRSLKDRFLVERLGVDGFIPPDFFL